MINRGRILMAFVLGADAVLAIFHDGSPWLVLAAVGMSVAALIMLLTLAVEDTK